MPGNVWKFHFPGAIFKGMMLQYGLLIFLTLSFVMFPVPDHGLKASAQAGSRERTQIKRTIQKKRLEAQKVLKKEMKLLGELERVDRRLEKEQDLAQKIVRQLSISRGKSHKLNTDIEKIFRRIEHRKKLLVRRLSAMYKLSRVGIMAALFSAASFPDLLMRFKYLSLTARVDSNLIGGYQDDLNRLEEQKRILSREIMLQRNLRQENNERLRSFNKAKEQKKKLLHRVRMEKTTHMQALMELEKANEELNRMMASLQPLEEGRHPKLSSLNVPYKPEMPGKDRSRAVSIEQSKGKLRSPVKGKIIERFGRKRHPRFNTVTFQKGVDIATSIGSEIKSIFKGQVIYSGWFPGYGKMLIIDHGKSYYSVYAHSSRLLKKVGDIVVEGEMIGLAGETGSLKGPCLYFEIRHHGVPLDPLDWIRI